MLLLLAGGYKVLNKFDNQRTNVLGAEGAIYIYIELYIKYIKIYEKKDRHPNAIIMSQILPIQNACLLAKVYFKVNELGQWEHVQCMPQWHAMYLPSSSHCQ